MKLASKVFLIISVVLRSILCLLCLVGIIITAISPIASQEGQSMIGVYVGLLVGSTYCIIGLVFGIISLIFLRKTDQEIKAKQTTAIIYSVLNLIFTGFIGGLMFLLYVLIDLENVEPKTKSKQKQKIDKKQNLKK